MMTEAAAIAERLGVHLRVGIDKRLDGAAAIGAHKMSMLQDLERGRSMEIEPIVGVVQELGRLTRHPDAGRRHRARAHSSARAHGAARGGRMKPTVRATPRAGAARRPTALARKDRP